MRQSRYNWLFEYEGKTLLFNGATGCLAELLEEEKDSIVQALREPDDGASIGAMPR